jgi:hypothetical protein
LASILLRDHSFSRNGGMKAFKTCKENLLYLQPLMKYTNQYVHRAHPTARIAKNQGSSEGINSPRALEKSPLPLATASGDYNQTGRHVFQYLVPWSRTFWVSNFRPQEIDGLKPMASEALYCLIQQKYKPQSGGDKSWRISLPYRSRAAYWGRSNAPFATHFRRTPLATQETADAICT